MPVVDEVAADYGEIAFVAVAGRAGIDETRERAEGLFSDRLDWGLDQSVWEAFGVFGQPTSFLITADDKVYDMWFGAVGGDELRDRLDGLLALHG